MQVFTWNDKNDKNQKIILYIHGGAYLSQPISFHFHAVDKIARDLDAKVVFPIYPKIPRYPYKDAFSKMETHYKQVLAETSSSHNIMIMGDSAGGGFSLGFSLYARDHNLPEPKDIILLSPWLDLATDNVEAVNYEKFDPILSAWGLNRIGEL